MKKIILTIFISLFSVSVLSNSLDDLIVPPEEIINGKSLTEYTKLWWQWTYTMPDRFNPVNDLTGEHCHQGQNGNVWFLAGGYKSAVINRKCEIPVGKYLFFPLINILSSPKKPGTLTCYEAKKAATLDNSKLRRLEVELDSIKASNPNQTRLFTKDCFDLFGLVSKDLNPSRVYPSASDGYWVMLKPLSIGKHILSFKALYHDEKHRIYGKVLQHIQYELTIKEREVNMIRNAI